MQKIDPMYRWAGRLPTVCAELLPSEFRDRRLVCIRDVKAWTRVWQRWQGETTQPRINFSKQVVVIVRNVRYLNRIRYLNASVDDAVLTIKTMETRTARPIQNEFYGLILVFDAREFHSITDESEHVEVPGLVPSDQ